MPERLHPPQSGLGTVPPELLPDIFLSYAHVDNFSDLPDLETKGWVDRFGERLTTALWKRLGERVKIWRDDSDLKRADQISPTIQATIEQSALFLILISNRYLKSDSCSNELKWIERACQLNRRGVRGERVFPVLLYRIPEDRRPALCRDRVGYDFSNSTDDSVPGRPLDPQRELDRFTRTVRSTGDRAHPTPERSALERCRAAHALTGREGVPRPHHRNPGNAPASARATRQALTSDGIAVIDEKVPPPYELTDSTSNRSRGC